MDMDTDTDTKLYGDSHILPAIVRKKPNIFITGTPGVGKTSLAKLLMQKIEGMHYINVDDYVTDKTIYEKWGGLFNLSDDDKDSIIKELEPKMALGGNIVDFHTSYFFPKHWFDLVKFFLFFIIF
jgi:adenylate kinase